MVGGTGLRPWGFLGVSVVGKADAEMIPHTHTTVV